MSHKSDNSSYKHLHQAIEKTLDFLIYLGATYGACSATACIQHAPFSIIGLLCHDTVGNRMQGRRILAIGYGSVQPVGSTSCVLLMHVTNG